MGAYMDSPELDAATLLVYLERLQEQGRALHKIRVRVEVSDSYYDKDLREADLVLVKYENHEDWSLIFHGD